MYRARPHLLMFSLEIIFCLTQRFDVRRSSEVTSAGFGQEPFEGISISTSVESGVSFFARIVKVEFRTPECVRGREFHFPSAVHVTFLFDLTSYGQPATFKLIGATGERLPQTWGRLAVTVHLLFLNQRGVGFS